MGLASVVLDRTIHILSTVIMTLTGIVIGFFVLNIPLYVTFAVFLAFLAILSFLIYLLKKQSEGFIEFILGKIPRKWVDRFINEYRWEKVKALDYEIAFIFSSRANIMKFFISLGIHYLSGLGASCIEVYLIIRFSGRDIAMIHAMYLYLFNMLFTTIVFFMPANLGTSEGSYSLALKFLGYDPAIGLTVGIIRRLRTFVWAGIGVAILFYAGLLGKRNQDQQ